MPHGDWGVGCSKGLMMPMEMGGCSKGSMYGKRGEEGCEGVNV